MKKILATLLSLACILSLVACGGSTSSSSTPENNDSNSAVSDEGGETATTGLKIAQVQGAAHGTKCFTTATVVTDGEKILLAYLDEYQVMGKEGTTPVPNSDADFGAAVADETKALVSKKVNTVKYSENMAKAGSTVGIAENMAAVEKFAEGKTVAELEEVLTKTKEEVVEAVAGCTLVDADGYLKTIVEAAKAAEGVEAVAFDGDLSTLKINKVEAAAHGTKCFTTATVVTAGEKIVLAWLDEYQFMGEGAVGVPNSDADFGGNFVEGKTLVSKKVNNVMYSENMAKAGSTVTIADNMKAVEKFAEGKTVAELEEVLTKTKEEVVEAVAGSTLVDTDGYLKAIAAAAK